MKPKSLNAIKSFVILMLICCLSLVITSCDKLTAKDKNEDIKKSNTLGEITIASLTEREKGLVRSLGGDTTYIFDVNLDKKINSDWVDLWIDHYEKGVLKKPSQSLGFGLTSGENKILNDTFIFSVENLTVDTPVVKWVLGNNRGYRSMVSVKDTKFNNFISMSNDNIEIVEDKVLNLAILKQGQSSNSLTNTVFSDEEELKKDIAETEHLYILRCKFSKNRKLN